MTILGIDPSTVSGFALCEFADNGTMYLTQYLADKKCDIKLLKNPEMLGLRIERLSRLPQYPHGANIAVEIPQHGPSSAVFGAQMRMVGALMATLIMTGREVHEVGPTAVKKAMTGYGFAKKDDMVAAAEHMVGKLTGIKVEREAIADAIGHAVTLALSLGWKPTPGVMPPPMEKPPTKRPRPKKKRIAAATDRSDRSPRASG